MIPLKNQTFNNDEDAMNGKADVGPVFFRLSMESGEQQLEKLLKAKPHITIHDEIQAHLKEWVKLTHPSEKLPEEVVRQLAEEHLEGCPARAYGVWVYYPWLEKLVHLPDEDEFAAIRTNRNLYKITREERAQLATKKVGVIGLSVGQSVAMALAMERSFGELRIADFDTLEISNMNRIRTGVQNLGLPKTTIVAREIAEIDPFLKVSCFNEGIHSGNIDDFIYGEGKLDMLIDECDSLEIKVLARREARKAKIPVLMDTSDRGMIDIERFDLEPGRPLFHGLIGEDISENALRDPNLRVQLSLQIAGAANISSRMKSSLQEIGKTISTWPQLATSVLLGGAVIAELSRKILLRENIPSGRFYVDLEEIIKLTDGNI